MHKRTSTLIRQWFFLGLCGFGALSASLQSLGITLKDVQAKSQGMSANQVQLYKQIGNKLRCPTCTGLSVMQSDALFSLQIRSAVLDQIQSTQDEKTIMKFFTERYGLWILREPPKQGIHLLAWGIPVFFILMGLIVAIYLFRNPRRKSRTHQENEKIWLEQMHTELKTMRKQGS